MTTTPVSPPTEEDPDHPAGPPVYTWDVEQGWWRCLLCNSIATPLHITSRKHESRYSDHLQHPVVLPPAQPRPDQAARAAAGGGGTEPAQPPPPPPLPAQAVDGQRPVPGPAPAPLGAIHEERGIRQDEEGVDRLVCRLAVLLEQADVVLADIFHARQAERRAVGARRQLSQRWQPWDDPVRRRRDEPRRMQALSVWGEPRRHRSFGEASQLTDADGSAPRDGPPGRHQNGRWHGRCRWQDDAQQAWGTWSWDERTDAGRQ